MFWEATHVDSWNGDFSPIFEASLIQHHFVIFNLIRYPTKEILFDLD